MIGHGKESEESCSSANQDEKKVIERNDQEETQNVLDLCKGDILDILTMHIAAPLEAFVQKKWHRSWLQLFMQSWKPGRFVAVRRRSDLSSSCMSVHSDTEMCFFVGENILSFCVLD